MVTLEKITLQAEGYSLRAVTSALMQHSDLHSLDDAEHVAYAFPFGISDEATEAVVTFPSFSMANAPFAAKIHYIGKGQYEIERFGEFPSGFDLSSFNPAKYEKRSRVTAFCQRRGWE